MKTINLIVFGLMLAFLASSCSRTISFSSSTIVPAATGQVKIKKDKNRNYAITVEVLNLAEPKMLSPAREAYVVWMEAGREPVKKLGQINPSSGLFSKTLKARLNATSIEEPNHVFITAENNIDVQYPNGDVILTTRR
jgi:hypothetical protein